MSKAVVEKLLEKDMVVIFDIDGVLCPYEWGFFKHSLSNDEWNRVFLNHVDLYSKRKPVKKLKQFIDKKDKDKVFVCSVGEIFEVLPKTSFCEKYGILPYNVRIVENTVEKLLYLEHLQQKLGIEQENIAIVEDTVSTLDHIARNSDFMTVHISSFFDLEGED